MRRSGSKAKFRKFLFFIGVCLTVIASWWSLIRVNEVQLMSVRSKEWWREIKELEDYRSYECHTHIEKKCTGLGVDKVCRDEFVERCDWETRTRTINTCQTQGKYPVAPYWADCPIGAGHYERRLERYIIHFSDDIRLYDQISWSKAYYDELFPGQRCQVSLNWFKWVLHTNCYNERKSR